MEVKDIISQVEGLFGRKPNRYLMQIINDGLMDIASKRLTNEDTAVTDLLEGQRYYEMPPGLLKIVSVEVKQENTDGGLEFAPLQKIDRTAISIGDES
jgi:hypothetical protein|tara:strand:- start:4076 stop:4369 length:294 start_codon:yes stop_codon:yes gene_type:complete